MAIHNIERCRDECRTFLLIAAVVLVPAPFHTFLLIAAVVLVPALFHTIKKAVSIVSHIQIPTRSWMMMFHCVHTWLNIFIYLLFTKQS